MIRDWKQRRKKRIRRRIAAICTIAIIPLIVFAIKVFAVAPETEKEVEIVEITRPEESDEAVKKEKILDQEFSPDEELKLSADMQQLTYEICKEYQISFPFVIAIMESESQFDPNAVGDDGHSIGYMQINEINWERMATDHALDVNIPEDNIRAGIIMLAELFEDYDDPYAVIECYKCGESRGMELFNQGIFKTATFDCSEICRRSVELERSFGLCKY
ncbi:MAG: lytic transglycosylase domain-containing protein [Lachnospiraceae bacterium]|nr:lytic transglycosylase domain-containing protein [Lachnospiraceae bacterium]